MDNVILNILLAPLAVILYGSGLLLWPIRRWRERKRAFRGKALGFVFLAQCISYIGVLVIAFLLPRLLEHAYYWFIVLIESNVAFTIAGVIAWIRDSRYDRTTEVHHTA